MSKSYNMNTIKKFLAKEMRPKNYRSNHPSELESSVNYLKPQQEEEKVEDLGYYQRQLVKPKSTSTYVNQQGFHESKLNNK